MTVKAAPLHPKHERHDACTGKFCGACAAHFYRGQLEDGMWNLRCPSVGCTAAPHDGTMAMLPGGELLATWRAQLRSAARCPPAGASRRSPELASWARATRRRARASRSSSGPRAARTWRASAARNSATCGAPWPCGQATPTRCRGWLSRGGGAEAVAMPVAA